MKDEVHVKIPKNYKETEVIEFSKIGNKNEKINALMFMLRPDPGEDFEPRTIFIPLNPSHQDWLIDETRLTPDEFITQVSECISHEILHITLHKVSGRVACDGLDVMGFGLMCRWCHHDKTDGLMNFSHIFKPRKKKLVGWK